MRLNINLNLPHHLFSSSREIGTIRANTRDRFESIVTFPDVVWVEEGRKLLTSANMLAGGGSTIVVEEHGHKG